MYYGGYMEIHELNMLRWDDFGVSVDAHVDDSMCRAIV